MYYACKNAMCCITNIAKKFHFHTNLRDSSNADDDDYGCSSNDNDNSQLQIAACCVAVILIAVALWRCHNKKPMLFFFLYYYFALNDTNHTYLLFKGWECNIFSSSCIWTICSVQCCCLLGPDLLHCGCKQDLGKQQWI